MKQISLQEKSTEVLSLLPWTTESAPVSISLLDLVTLFDLRLRALENPSAQPTTAETTKTAPIPAPVWDVPDSPMIPTTLPSLQSDQAGTPSGHVEPGSGCAHRAMRIEAGLLWMGPKKWGMCLQCNVWMWFELTPVPAAPTT